MNYYVKGDKTKAEQIKAAFEKLGIRVPDYRICMYSSLIYFSLNGEVLAITIKALELFQNNPDYKELELPVEPKFKAEDRIVSKNDKGTVYRIIALHEELRKYIVDIEHKDHYESCPWIAFEDQDDFELAPKPHYDIANFKPFDKVLVRYYSTDNWKCGLFSHLSTQKGAKFVCVGATYYQCIPFNEDNKHLLGTFDMCDEKYVNWQ